MPDNNTDRMDMLYKVKYMRGKWVSVTAFG